MRNTIFCLAFLVLAVTAYEEFRGDQVLRIVPQSASHVHFLKKYFEKNQEFDAWTEPSAPHHNVDVKIPGEKLEEIKQMLSKRSIKFSVMVQDVEDLLNEEEMSNQKNAFASYFDYEKYNMWSEIRMELSNLVRQYGRYASLFNVGRTYEGESQLGIKVTNGDGISKPVIWIDGGIHAREWISPATVMYFIKKLLDSKTRNDDTSVITALNRYDFYFLPVFNIDGYKYTFTSRETRFWRKTRSNRGNGFCYGADPNRNWDSQWYSGAGTSDNPCRDTYRGTGPESEIEVKNVATFLKTLNLKSYWNVHAYSQLVLTPWSYMYRIPKDYGEMKRVGNIFAQTVKVPYGTTYRVGPPPALLYAVSGGSIDYAYEKLGVIYSYALELRDKGTYGFVLPANQIKPSGEETSRAFLAAILAMH